MCIVKNFPFTMLLRLWNTARPVMADSLGWRKYSSFHCYHGKVENSLLSASAVHVNPKATACHSRLVKDFHRVGTKGTKFYPYFDMVVRKQFPTLCGHRLDLFLQPRGLVLLPSFEVQDDAYEQGRSSEKHCSSVLKKRRKKMRRHKYRKWRKRMRFKRRALK